MHAVQLHRDRGRFEQAGLRLAVVGQGEPSDAAEFRRSQGLDELPLLVDTELRAYTAAGAKRSTLLELVGPGPLISGLRKARAAGVAQGATVGDAALVGGALVVASDGEVLHAHMSHEPADVPSNEELLAAV